MHENDDDLPIKVETYADMATRPRFVDQLDPTKHKLKAILAEYHLSHNVLCALLDRTRHRHGVLVVTEDGIETNIGADCAAREFPDQYDALHQRFNVHRARVAHLDMIREYQSRVASCTAEMNSVWYDERGGWWADQCRAHYLSLCPSAIRQRLSHVARTSSSWTLTMQVKVDSEDAINLGFRRDQSHEDVTVGVLRGGAALLKSVHSVLHPLKLSMDYYATLDPLTLARPKRRQWAEWSRSVPSQIEQAHTLVNAARELYEPDNLDQLTRWTNWQDERNGIKKFIRAVEQVEAAQRIKAG